MFQQMWRGGRREYKRRFYHTAQFAPQVSNPWKMVLIFFGVLIVSNVDFFDMTGLRGCLDQALFVEFVIIILLCIIMIIMYIDNY